MGPKNSPHDYSFIICFSTPHFKVVFLSLLNYTNNIAVFVFFFFFNNDGNLNSLIINLYDSEM